MLQEVDHVLEKLDWMRAERIWPNGERYLWTDAFGVSLSIRARRLSTPGPTAHLTSTDQRSGRAPSAFGSAMRSTPSR